MRKRSSLGRRSLRPRTRSGGEKLGRPALALYGELAPFYSLIYSEKDYRAETIRLRRLAKRFGRSRGRAWLDVACGNGGHLEHLRRSYDVVGVDASSAMVRLARERLPGVRIQLGDMRSFRLDRQFDVVSCLFSAIGHLRVRKDVARTFANFARHLVPGGVAIVEPWIERSDARPGLVHLVTRARDGDVVVRLAYSRIRGDRSNIEYHYLVGQRGKGIRYRTEFDQGLLLYRTEMVALMREAGLRPTFLVRGVSTRRGVLLGVKPIRPRNATGESSESAGPSAGPAPPRGNPQRAFHNPKYN